MIQNDGDKTKENIAELVQFEIGDRVVVKNYGTDAPHDVIGTITGFDQNPYKYRVETDEGITIHAKEDNIEHWNGYWDGRKIPKKIFNKSDAVNHPSHYTSGKIEVWDFIADQKLDYDKGCAVKYICRAGKKDSEKEIEDLRKAVAYINHEIGILEKE